MQQKDADVLELAREILAVVRSKGIESRYYAEDALRVALALSNPSYIWDEGGES